MICTYLISSKKPIGYLHKAYNDIRNEYSSILKEYGLSLNTRKCCIKETKEINNELKKSLYDEYFSGQKHDIEEHFSGELLKFIKDLSLELLLDSISIEDYNKIIEQHFSSDDIEFTASEVFNYYVYENDTELQTEAVINEIIEIVKQSISFINLDPKRLTIMIMKTKSEVAIKSFLSQLFERNRNDEWNSYDTTIAISYLIQRGFANKDLLEILSKRHSKLYSYYYHNCKRSFFKCFDHKRVKKICEVIGNDKKTNYLYFMYLCECKRQNNMAAFAYFKNYFDRITANLDYYFHPEPKKKKPNYKGFYKDKSFIIFYSKINSSKTIIEQAHKLRNANPLCHSSLELLDNENTSNDLIQSIKDMKSLIYKYIQTYCS